MLLRIILIRILNQIVRYSLYSKNTFSLCYRKFVYHLKLKNLNLHLQ